MAYDKPLKGVHRPEGTKGLRDQNEGRLKDTRQQNIALMRSLPKTASKLQGSQTHQNSHVKGGSPQQAALTNRPNHSNNKPVSNQQPHDGQEACAKAKKMARVLSNLTSSAKAAPVKEGNLMAAVNEASVSALPSKKTSPDLLKEITPKIFNNKPASFDQRNQNPRVVIDNLNKLLKGKKVIDSAKADVKDGKDPKQSALAQKVQPKTPDQETLINVGKFVANGGIPLAKDSTNKQETKKLDGIHKDSAVASTGRSDGKLPIARKEELSSETGGQGSDTGNEAGKKLTQKNFVWKTISGVGKLASAGLAAVGKRLSGLISGGVNVVRTIATKFLPYKGKHGFGIGASERGLKDVKVADLLAGPGNNIDGGMNG
ncbi:MAG: hypothetical protein ABIE74_08255 [Pseudomonadota bacterium]